jgi:hypothetical protein
MTATAIDYTMAANLVSQCHPTLPIGVRKSPSKQALALGAASGTNLDTGQVMNDRHLLRHLSWIVLLKLALLTVLWWVFFRPVQVPVHPDTAAAHIAPGPAPVASPTAPQGVRP